MPSLPTPLRAAIGLAAQALQDAKRLPDKAIELPMLAVSTALQLSLRAQQRYALLAARGDDVLNRRPTTDEPPPWATFDDPIATYAESAQTAPRQAAPARTAPRKTVPAKVAPAKITAVPATPRKSPAAKTVRSPRNAAPSRFDTIGDE